MRWGEDRRRAFHCQGRRVASAAWQLDGRRLDSAGCVSVARVYRTGHCRNRFP